MGTGCNVDTLGRRVKGVLWVVLSVVVVLGASVVVVENDGDGGGGVTLEKTYVGLGEVVEEPALMIIIIDVDKLGLYVVAVLLLSGVEDVIGK